MYVYVCVYVLWHINTSPSTSSVNLTLIQATVLQPGKLNYLIPEFSMNGISALTGAESQILN